MRFFRDKTIWLIGASEGIGEQLAFMLAQHGARMIISARNDTKLRGMKPRLEGERHIAQVMDVTDNTSVSRAWRNIINKKAVPDIIIYNAGAYELQSVLHFDLPSALKIMDVNLTGAMRMLSYVLPTLIKRKAGHIVLVGSVAGYRGLPNSLAYGTSKAGLIHLAECLRTDLEKYNIKVQLVSPGFVKTRLTDKNDFDMPAMISAQHAAYCITKGMYKSKFDIHFPKRFTIFLKLLRVLPYPLYFRIIKKFDKKH